MMIPGLQRLCRILRTVCQAHREWHSLQATDIRCVEKAHEHYRTEACGGRGLDAIAKVFSEMQSPAAQKFCGFTSSREEFEQSFHRGELLVAEEEEMFEDWFRLACNVNFFRLRTLLWHLRGPGLLAGLLPGAPHHDVLKVMQAQFAARTAAIESGVPEVVAAAGRSWLNTPWQQGLLYGLRCCTLPGCSRASAALRGSRFRFRDDEDH